MQPRCVQRADTACSSPPGRGSPPSGRARRARSGPRPARGRSSPPRLSRSAGEVGADVGVLLREGHEAARVAEPRWSRTPPPSPAGRAPASRSVSICAAAAPLLKPHLRKPVAVRMRSENGVSLPDVGQPVDRHVVLARPARAHLAHVEAPPRPLLEPRHPLGLVGLADLVPLAADLQQLARRRRAATAASGCPTPRCTCPAAPGPSMLSAIAYERSACMRAK